MNSNFEKMNFPDQKNNDFVNKQRHNKLKCSQNAVIQFRISTPIFVLKRQAPTLRVCIQCQLAPESPTAAVCWPQLTQSQSSAPADWLGLHPPFGFGFFQKITLESQAG